jgi:hypothetical protein
MADAGRREQRGGHLEYGTERVVVSDDWKPRPLYGDDLPNSAFVHVQVGARPLLLPWLI